MKNIKLLLLPLLYIALISCGVDNNGKNENPVVPPKPIPGLPEIKGKIIVAYFTSWTNDILPDGTSMTHINYAFGHVNSSFNGVRIDNPQRLQEVVALKKEHPSLNVLLSIGGWGSDGFSMMARDTEKRKAFVADCKRVIDEYKLDGVDLDWEYPTSSTAKIVSHPDDTENFTKLIKEIRATIGNLKLLTFASSASAKYVDFMSVEPYVNFVNIMGYDYHTPPYHHSALYASAHSSELTSDAAVKAHLKAGVPANKLVLGVPFYGLCDQKEGLPYSINYKDIKGNEQLSKFTERWDDEAKVPYYATESGKLVFSFENEKSLGLKCDYILENDLLGVMYWEYGNDDLAGTLRSTLHTIISSRIAKLNF